MKIRKRIAALAAAAALVLTICCLFSGCTKYVRLEKTPEHCYEGADLQTLDYVCDYAYGDYGTTGNAFTYSTSNVMSTYFQYVHYLSDRGFEAYASGLTKSIYKTEYGKITVEIVSELMGEVSHVSGRIKVTIDR